MSLTENEDRPWWTYGEVATKPSKTDVGAICGHTRDRHDATGQCLIYERTFPMGGYEGEENGKTVTLPDQGELYESDGGGVVRGHYHRDACFCSGETVWHIATLPPDFEWDGLTQASYKGDEEHPIRRTSSGEYVWWIEPPKKKK